MILVYIDSNRSVCAIFLKQSLKINLWENLRLPKGFDFIIVQYNFTFKLGNTVLFKTREVIIYLIIWHQNEALGKLFKKGYIILSIAGSYKFGKQNRKKKTKKKDQNSGSYVEKSTFHYIYIFILFKKMNKKFKIVLIIWNT